MAPLITVITPTARYGGIDISWHGLKNQTFKSFEWLIVDEINREKEILSYCADTRVRWLKSPPKKPGMFWNLDQSGNFALRHAQGKLIVNLQDYIYLPPDALQKFVDTYEKISSFSNGDLALSGVGHKYIVPNLTVSNLKGKVTVYHEDVTKTDLKWELFDKDPRMNLNGLYVCNPVEWEANFSLVPKNLMFELGGWDEELDAGWGYDNVNLAERIVAHGGLCWIDQDNESYSVSHEHLFKHIDFKESAPNNEDLWARKNASINRGEEIYLRYLT